MPTLVSVHKLWKYGNTGLQRKKIKEYCEKGILPCIYDAKTNRYKIFAEEVEEALRAHGESQAKAVLDTSRPFTKTKGGRDWSM